MRIQPGNPQPLEQNPFLKRKSRRFVISNLRLLQGILNRIPVSSDRDFRFIQASNVRGNVSFTIYQNHDATVRLYENSKFKRQLELAEYREVLMSVGILRFFDLKLILHNWFCKSVFSYTFV